MTTAFNERFTERIRKDLENKYLQAIHLARTTEARFERDKIDSAERDRLNALSKARSEATKKRKAETQQKATKDQELHNHFILQVQDALAMFKTKTDALTKTTRQADKVKAKGELEVAEAVLKQARSALTAIEGVFDVGRADLEEEEEEEEV